MKALPEPWPFLSPAVLARLDLSQVDPRQPDPRPPRSCVLSYHDHWLSEEEASSRAMYFDDFKRRRQLPAYYAFETAVLDWCRGLFSPETFLLAESDHKHGYGLYQCDSWTEFAERLKPELREEGESMTLLLPTCGAVIMSNYDLTWPVWLYGTSLEAFARRIDHPQIHVLP